jgi:hypothetical protein
MLGMSTSLLVSSHESRWTMGRKTSIGQRVQTGDSKVLQTIPDRLPGVAPVVHRLLIPHNQRQEDLVESLVGDPQRTEVF